MCRTNVLAADGEEEEEGEDRMGTDDVQAEEGGDQPPYVENIERSNSNYANLQASVDSM